MVLGQSIEVVLFQETGLEEATQTALTNYAEETGVEMTFYEEVLDYGANPENAQPCAVMDSILLQKDVAIFLGGTKPQHCNWADIVPQLHQFVLDGGTLIFQGPNADGGMAFFFESEQWEQFDEDPWFGAIDDSQHWCCGLGVENANCEGSDLLFGVPHVNHPVFSGAYDYPFGQQGVCDMMIFEPSWYTLGAADLDDPRFFSILEFGQALNTGWVHEGEDTQMIFGKSLGAGHVVFYGENNPLPNPYTGSQTLLGNMVVYFSEEPGCTNENACNYDPEANVDDGSCLALDACGECGEEGVAGCTAPEACNYNPTASCDDGGCVYPPVIDLGEDVVTCEEEITLQAGQGYGSYAWNTGETSESIVVSESGVYEVTVDEYNQNAHSLSFDGADDYMDVPDIAPELYNDAFTIMVHAYLEDVTETDFYNILSTDDNSPGNLFQWGCKPNDLRPELYASNGAGGFAVYSSNTPITDNQWHHIAISYNGYQASSGAGELRFYTDGVETGVHSADIDVSASLTIVGHYLLDFPDLLGALEPWSGGLDDMQIWNTPLSESEIFDFMNCPPSPGTDGLVAYWNFDAGQGDSVVDLSGNGFHGTLMNGTAWSEELPSLACTQQCSSSDSILVSLFGYHCLCGDGTLWDESSGECVPVLSSQNACGEGTEWDVESQTCIISNPSDTNFDGCVSMTDLLDLLSVFGTCNEIPWSCGDLLEYQGYNYETVQIGEQCWFAENLRAESYRNGDLLESALGDAAWVNSTAGAIATYGAESGCSDNVPDFDACNPESALAEFGLLYNGFSVDDERQICPTGWSVPTVSGWEDLEDYAGGHAQAGIKLKSANGWADDGNGFNEVFFDGKPGGYLWGFGAAVDNYQAGLGGYWWAQGGEEDPYAFYLKHDSQGSFVSTFAPQHGFSVRCIKDSE